MVAGWRVNSPSKASAGGQEEQPCDVNSSNTTGTAPRWHAPTRTAGSTEWRSGSRGGAFGFSILRVRMSRTLEDEHCYTTLSSPRGFPPPGKCYEGAPARTAVVSSVREKPDRMTILSRATPLVLAAVFILAAGEPPPTAPAAFPPAPPQPSRKPSHRQPTSWHSEAPSA